MKHRKKPRLADSEDLVEKNATYSIFTLESVHPNNLKPLGNAFFEADLVDCRSNGLGRLNILEDEVILEILSKALYIFSGTDELWKALCLDSFDGDFKFECNWKMTYIRRKLEEMNKQLTIIPKPLVIQGFFSDALYNRWYFANMDLECWTQVDNIDRRSNLSLEEFISQYEIPNKPVVIVDIVPRWRAFTEWTREKLLERYGNVSFKTDQGVSMKLYNYFLYCGMVKEASPLYLFDNEFATKIPELLQDYEVPEFFKEDFFKVLETGDDHRPSFRWLLIGPPRSGSSFHKDPNATSAWNGLLRGLKKWILYPPDRIPPGVFPSADGWEVETPESVVEWFRDFYPQSQKRNVYHPIECVLRPGELLFIPSGWWHTALNIQESIAVTQNYVSSQNLSEVLRFLKSKQKQTLYQQFIQKIEQQYPGVLGQLETKSRRPLQQQYPCWRELREPNSDAWKLFG